MYNENMTKGSNLSDFNVQDDDMNGFAEILSLDYDQKVKMLERIVQDTLSFQVEYAEITGRYFELKAKIQIYKQVGSQLQSAIKAERSM